MCEETIFKQGTEEWKEWRKTKLGASDAPVVMGDSPWKSAVDLWREKKGLWEQPDNSAMHRGREMEPVARAKYEEMTSSHVYPYVAIHPEHNWMIASLDGIDLSGTKGVEIKCPGAQDHQEAREGRVPKKYYAQLQHQMACAGLESIDYFSYRHDEGVIVTIGIDKAYVERMIEKEKAFMEMLKGDKEPEGEAKGKDYEDKSSDREWLFWAMVYQEADAEEKAALKKKESAKKILVELAGEKNCKGSGVVLTRCKKAGSIDYKAIPELSGVDLNKYRGEGSSYVTIRIE